ncbi:MAG TPA: hypothetical protein VHE37_10615 [Nevskiaceae bacterium]|nr:hypothetical protein [Nevskiaceae bacterium]
MSEPQHDEALARLAAFVDRRNGGDRRRALPQMPALHYAAVIGWSSFLGAATTLVLLLAVLPELGEGFTLDTLSRSFFVLWLACALTAAYAVMLFRREREPA